MNQLNNKLLANVLEGPGIQPISDSTGGSAGQIEKIISAVIGILTLVGVIYFTIQIIMAGIAMISSQGDPKELESAKKRLTTNLLGLAIIVIAYGLGALIASLLGMNSIFDLTTIFQPIN
ncbi:MAG TPA: hypothetical protein PK257_02400 [Candidatus Woesebacteria bacterium]|nr:hypothetical protein [Candidatus Woesebacteria bacterium]